MAKVLVLLAHGFEEIEAFAPIDIMRRAKIDVVAAGVGEREIVSGHAVHVLADKVLGHENSADYDMLILPGGAKGADNIRASKPAIEVIQDFYHAKKYISAICAAPYILADLGMLDGLPAVCYPAPQYIEKLSKAHYKPNQLVVVTDQIITAAGAGAATDFAFEIVKRLVGENTSDQIRKEMLFLLQT